MYLNENEAANKIEEIAKEFTDDVKVRVMRRKPKNLTTKDVIFGMKVSPNDSELFFDGFMKATVDGEALELIESEMIIEDQKQKDIFVIRATVQVVRVEV